MTDPNLVVRYHQDRFGLLVVKTVLRYPGGRVEEIGVARRVDKDQIGRTVFPTESDAGVVPLSGLPGRRATKNGEWRRPYGR